MVAVMIGVAPNKAHTATVIGARGEPLCLVWVRLLVEFWRLNLVKISQCPAFFIPVAGAFEQSCCILVRNDCLFMTSQALQG